MQQAAAVKFAKAGAMTPVDTMLTKEQLAELRGLDTSTFEGKLWGLPTEYHPVYLWYRPSLLKAAGVEVPQTWDDYLAALRKLQKVDASGKVERYGSPRSSWGSAARGWTPTTGRS